MVSCDTIEVVRVGMVEKATIADASLSKTGQTGSGEGFLVTSRAPFWRPLWRLFQSYVRLEDNNSNEIRRQQLE